MLLFLPLLFSLQLTKAVLTSGCSDPRLVDDIIVADCVDAETGRAFTYVDFEKTFSAYDVEEDAAELGELLLDDWEESRLATDDTLLQRSLSHSGPSRDTTSSKPLPELPDSATRDPESLCDPRQSWRETTRGRFTSMIGRCDLTVNRTTALVGLLTFAFLIGISTNGIVNRPPGTESSRDICLPYHNSRICVHFASSDPRTLNGPTFANDDSWEAAAKLARLTAIQRIWLVQLHGSTSLEGIRR